MATFTYVPDFRAQKKSEPSIRTVKFGDGYEQRLKFGLNQNPKVWDLTWSAVDNDTADAIEAFFDARAADGDAFDWTPLDSATSYKFVCTSWNREYQYADINIITATFRQVYEP